ncbi:aldo/keto reductase [Brevibacillus humidisoli]|uniref:aldo/keto reductase n=1 Tax=Brevibacillus humidisoli TaxID=2895522 RepID=UPI001E46D718|nr:aldo/keto reductase [Brevibacillus humidisoli]UFJ41816.1 aldo/keto reductase [Brevibacillus humidisoli]
MRYRRLGRTNLKVSVVGVGTWQYGGEWGRTYSQDEVDRILSKAKEVGINLIDTAECYGDHVSEAFIGEFVKKDRREDWIIATKFGHKFHENFQRSQLWSPQEVLKQLEDSLRALQTDYIDLYQFHSGTDEMFDNDDLWTMLEKQVEAGKVRHLGISIAKNDNLHQTAAASKVNAKTIQVVYNRLDQTPEERVFPSCIEQDLGVLARVPLASGYLSGKYKPDAVFAENDVRNNHDPEQRLQKLQQVEAIKREEVPEGMDMATWALVWCLKHDAVTCVIPGCKDEKQVVANAKAAEYVSDDHPQAWKM